MGWRQRIVGTSEEVVRLRGMLFAQFGRRKCLEDDEVAVPFVGQYEWWLQQIRTGDRSAAASPLTHSFPPFLPLKGVHMGRPQNFGILAPPSPCHRLIHATYQYCHHVLANPSPLVQMSCLNGPICIISRFGEMIFSLPECSGKRLQLLNKTMDLLKFWSSSQPNC